MSRDLRCDRMGSRAGCRVSACMAKWLRTSNDAMLHGAFSSLVHCTAGRHVKSMGKACQKSGRNLLDRSSARHYRYKATTQNKTRNSEWTGRSRSDGRQDRLCSNGSLCRGPWAGWETRPSHAPLPVSTARMSATRMVEEGAGVLRSLGGSSERVRPLGSDAADGCEQQIEKRINSLAQAWRTAISAVRRTTCGCISERSRAAGAGRVLLTIAPVLRWQRDLGRQTDEVHGCTAGLLRAGASPHQLSITLLSAGTISAGHGRGCQFPVMVVAASSISGGEQTYNFSGILVMD